MLIAMTHPIYITMYKEGRKGKKRQWSTMVGRMVQNSQSLYLLTLLLSFTNVFIHIQQLNL